MRYTNLWEDLEHKDKRIAELEAQNAELHRDGMEPRAVLRSRIAELETDIEGRSMIELDLKEKIKELESEVANLRAAFAKRKVEFIEIERDLVDCASEDGLKNKIIRLEAELATASEAFAKRDIERHNRIKELEAELAKVKVELNLRREQMSRFPFCPDHRDKVHGKECRECEVEHLRRCLKRLEWAADGRCPVCGKPKSCGHHFEVWLAAETGGK